MKVWTKVHIKDNNPQVNLVSKAFTNYLYGYGPIRDLCHKYNITLEDRLVLEQFTANRISGLLLLYLVKDFKRINDIANKYNVNANNGIVISPEIEGYIDK